MGEAAVMCADHGILLSHREGHTPDTGDRVHRKGCVLSGTRRMQNGSQVPSTYELREHDRLLCAERNPTSSFLCTER